MPDTISFKCEKLIRDRLQENFLKIGVHLETEIMKDSQYLSSLKDKILEEAQEVFQANSPEALTEEMGDLIEVILTLAKCHGVSFQDIEKKRLEKRLEKGGFESKVYCYKVTMNQKNPKVDYYRSYPETYPEIPYP